MDFNAIRLDPLRFAGWMLQQDQERGARNRRVADQERDLHQVEQTLGELVRIQMV